MCYSEYAVDYPIAGGSFTFMLQTFGEFPGWCVRFALMLFLVSAQGSSAWHPCNGLIFVADLAGGFRPHLVQGRKGMDIRKSAKA